MPKTLGKTAFPPPDSGQNGRLPRIPRPRALERKNLGPKAPWNEKSWALGIGVGGTSVSLYISKDTEEDHHSLL